MTAQFRCHACGAVRAANEKLIGHRIRCPECDVLVELPMLADDDGIFQSSVSRQDAGETAPAGATPAAAAKPPASSSQTSRRGKKRQGRTQKSEARDQASSAGPEAGGGRASQSRQTPEVAAGSSEAVLDLEMAVSTGAGREAGATSATSQQADGPAAKPLTMEEELAAEEAKEANADFETASTNSVESEMDMTPMVDVTFLLLIFFMVTASFTVQQALPVPNPKDDQPSTQTVEQDPEEDNESVTVEVDEFNTYQVLTAEWEEEAPSVQELFARLQESREGVEGAIPSKLIVKAHTEAVHERVVAALDAGQKAGFEEIQLMTIDTEEE